jgi:thermitase
MRFVFGLLSAMLCLSTSAADTNLLIWHKAANRVDADIRGEPLWPLLETIARETGWRIYVEPGTTRSASAKFKDLPSDDALRMLLGDLNFARVPRTNAASQLYVFRTVMQNATRLVRATNAPAKHVPNELLVKLKLGVNIDDLAKLLGAKVVGRMDKLGIYRLQFDDGTATDVALGKLQNNSDVAEVDYNYYFDPPPSAQSLANAPVGPLSLKLNPPGDSGRVIVGLLDTAVQPLDGSLNDFLLKQLSVAGDAPANISDVTHGTAMAYTILQAIAAAEQGSSSVQIQPVDVYGPNPTTTSWDVALGVQSAVNNGATVLNMSLGSTGDSSILDDVILSAEKDGVVIFAAAGNQSVSTPTYPAATPGVIAVTALQNGQIAPYADFGSFVSLAFPGNNVVYWGSQAYMVVGTSVSTATATGVAAGNKIALGSSWGQIESAMQQKFAVPAK